jgi:hypothetical protein
MTINNLLRPPNTDGIVNCLLQPGHIRYQPLKSMLENSTYLLNSVHLDLSCTRDKVSRATGRRAVGSVFCSPFIKCTVTSKWRFHYLDSYVIGFYRDKTTSHHLPGLAKNSPTLTQTAPNYTTEPLAARQIAAKFSLYQDFRRTSKSFAARPCSRPCAAKHMLLCPPGLRNLDNFIMT